MLAALILILPQASETEAVRKVVEAVAAAAKENAARTEKERLTGDALADHYVRRAFASGQTGRAVTLGLAYALDPTSILARNPVTADAYKDVESAADAKARAAVMGTPTLRSREDWLVHFVVSAGLALLTGEQMAESIGIQKEVADAKGKEKGNGSGFSFTDLSADFAGIAFAEWVTGENGKEAVERCAKSFEGTSFLPDPKALEDGLTFLEFEKKFGGVKDPKFKDECKKLKLGVQGCKGYQ
jgi:hypothetical protein